MSGLPSKDEDQSDGESDRQANAMKDQLRKDVASWSATRSDGSARQGTESSVPVVKQPSPQPAKRVKRTKPAAAEVKSAAGAKKPFGMSYDGIPNADYITYMIKRGAR